jgi:hypothetical protein
MGKVAVLVLPVLILVVSGVLVADLGGNLGLALEARIGNLTPPGTKAEAKELKSLVKAQAVYEGALEIYDTIQEYEQLKDKTAVKLLAKTAKLIEKSRTGDPDILDDLDEIPELMEQWFGEVVAIVQNYEPELNGEQQSRIDDLLASLHGLERQAEGLWVEGSWGKSMKVYAKSLKVALKAWKLCVKYTGNELPLVM